MEYDKKLEYEKKIEYDKKMCPVVQIDGMVATGKQYDLDIIVGEDGRDVIYGVVRDCCREPIKDAVVKLIEIDCRHGKEERKPITHTFTDKNGEFVFGPLCNNREYEIQIWANCVKHIKVCDMCKPEGDCLKGEKIECKKPMLPHNDNNNYK